MSQALCDYVWKDAKGEWQTCGKKTTWSQDYMAVTLCDEHFKLFHDKDMKARALRAEAEKIEEELDQMSLDHFPDSGWM